MALSQGISEALINTAFGILTGALAVIYNYYTNKIDKLTYSLDEVGFSIVPVSYTHLAWTDSLRPPIKG